MEYLELLLRIMCQVIVRAIQAKVDLGKHDLRLVTGLLLTTVVPIHQQAIVKAIFDPLVLQAITDQAVQVSIPETAIVILMTIIRMFQRNRAILILETITVIVGPLESSKGTLARLHSVFNS